jgi:hypothetical protein
MSLCNEITALVGMVLIAVFAWTGWVMASGLGSEFCGTPGESAPLSKPIDSDSLQQPQEAEEARPTPSQEEQAAGDDGTAPADFDLDALRDRLRNTNAIGFFTKLHLKNQVDDLMAALRRFHKQQSNTTLEQLREQYNLLVNQVLILVQDEDTELAHDIATGRESLWVLLANPETFAKVDV